MVERVKDDMNCVDGKKMVTVEGSCLSQPIQNVLLLRERVCDMPCE